MRVDRLKNPATSTSRRRSIRGRQPSAGLPTTNFSRSATTAPPRAIVGTSPAASRSRSGSSSGSRCTRSADTSPRPAAGGWWSWGNHHDWGSKISPRPAAGGRRSWRNRHDRGSARTPPAIGRGLKSPHRTVMSEIDCSALSARPATPTTNTPEPPTRTTPLASWLPAHSLA